MSVIGYAILLSLVSSGTRYFGWFVVVCGLSVAGGIPFCWPPNSFPRLDAFDLGSRSSGETRICIRTDTASAQQLGTRIPIHSWEYIRYRVVFGLCEDRRPRYVGDKHSSRDCHKLSIVSSHMQAHPWTRDVVSCGSDGHAALRRPLEGVRHGGHLEELQQMIKSWKWS